MSDEELRAMADAASVGALDGVGAAGDLAGLARRVAADAGDGRQWRRCTRCGCCFRLRDEEPVPLHGEVLSSGRCGEGSDGR